MRLGNLGRYIVVAAISGTIGFLIGADRVPDTLTNASSTIAAQQRAASEQLQDQGFTLTGALSYLRARLSDGARRVTGLFDNDDNDE